MSKEYPFWTPFMTKHLFFYGPASLFGKHKINEKRKYKIRKMMDEAIINKDKEKAWVARDLAYSVVDQCPELLAEMHETMKKYGLMNS